jgi:site-specific DNA-methyltransferase (adenine-specific)/modification methylase
MIDVAQQTYVMIPLDRIVSKLPVRRLSASGVARIQESMRWAGFLENYPLTVTPLLDGNYELIDGSHRYEAAKGLGIAIAPCIVKENISEQERYKLAFQSNNAAETVVTSTLVDYAEFVWARVTEGYKQQEVAEMLGWGRTQVANYAALQKICPEAWRIIVTTLESFVTRDQKEAVTQDSHIVTFSEGLLRSILDLTHVQQVELVKELATNKDFSKGKFKTLAENYQSRNEMYAFAVKQLGDLGETYITQLKNAVYSGAYDADWKQTDHPKLQKLVTAIRDTWESKNSTRLIHGDFYEEVPKIGDGSIDLILTDPPYNVASDREFTGLKNHTPISQDFGTWDKYDYHEFLKLFPVWAMEWKRILRDQGSGYVFTSPEYCSHLWIALAEAGLCVKTVIVWYKPNPGQMIHHTTYKNSVEYVLFFTKGEGGHTFHWYGDEEMQNHINVPICSGNERLKDAKGDTLHATQKPVALLRHLIQISSNGGDTVFDGFMGVGSVGAACKGKDIQRKFIGIEHDKTFFDAAQRRLAE